MFVNYTSIKLKRKRKKKHYRAITRLRDDLSMETQRPWRVLSNF